MMPTLSATNLIDKILSSSKIEDIIDIKRDPRAQYKEISKLIHPDLCKSTNSSEASSKLNVWIGEFTDGFKLSDDSGQMLSNRYWVKQIGDKRLIDKSVTNYTRLMSISGAEHFKKYLPESMELTADGAIVNLGVRAIPLSQLSLTQEHINWVLSRLLEFSTLMCQYGYTHCGLTLDSIFIVPETHGIKITSFYHMTAISTIIKTVSAKYKDWYPACVFKTKLATPAIDLEMSKKMAIYLMGDPSGIGTVLKRTHSDKYIDFLLSYEDNPFISYDRYRKVLSDLFPKKFHILNM